MTNHKKDDGKDVILICLLFMCVILRSLNAISVGFSRNKLHEIKINVHNTYVLETVDLHD